MLPIVPLAQNTVVDKDALRKELEKVRYQGIAVSMEEYRDFFYGIAVPIRDYTCNVIAALGCCGLSACFTSSMIDQFSRLLIHAAEKISIGLGYEKASLNSMTPSVSQGGKACF